MSTKRETDDLSVVFIDADGTEYSATITDPHLDDPEYITESDVHPSEWEG